MGRSPKGFLAYTSHVEQKVKVMLKYITSNKSSDVKGEQAVRMSDLDDSFQSFKNSETQKSFTELEDSLNEVKHKHMSASVAPEKVIIKTPKKKQIVVKISIHSLDKSSDSLEKPDYFLNQSSLNQSIVSHNISQDSLDDDVARVKSFNQEAVTKQNKISKDIVALKNCKSFLEFDNLKNRVLLPTDAHYYFPETKSKGKDEEIAKIIKELVLKKFEPKRKEKPRKKISLIATGFSNSNIMDKSHCTSDNYKFSESNFINRSDLDSPFSRHLSNFEKKSMLSQTGSKSPTPCFRKEGQISAAFKEASVLVENNITNEESISMQTEGKKRESEIKINNMSFSLPYYASTLPSFTTSNQNKFKVRTQNSDTTKCKPKQNQTCNFINSRIERKESLMKEVTSTSGNLNNTYTKEDPVFHSDAKLKKPLPNILKSSDSNVSYYTTEELTNISSCSSQGVYDCLKKSVLKKEAVSLYFKEIEERTKNTSFQKSLSYEEIQYDKHKYLKEALGSEMEVSSLGVSLSTKKSKPIYNHSIDTDNISALTSSESCDLPKLSSRKPNFVNKFTNILRETSYEDLVYEAKYVPKHNTASSSSQYDSDMLSAASPRKTSRKSFPNVVRNNRSIFKQPRKTYPLYEDVLMAGTSNEDVNKTKGASEYLLQRISQQEGMIRQAEWVLEYGNKQRHFNGSLAHLETERIRLVSTLRKNALEKQLIDETNETQVTEETVLAKLVLKNVTCTSSVPHSEKSRKKQYFIGIFKSGVTVLCTNYAQPNMFGDVEFEGQFAFEDLKSDFEIKFSLYTMAIEKKEIGSKLDCFQRSLSKRYTKQQLELVGTHEFVKSTIGMKKAIKLENYRDYFAVYKFYANSDIFVKSVDRLKGVLTIGSEIKGHPVWNSAWCVLDGTDINCYHFPSDEYYQKPFNRIDLKNCHGCQLDHNVGKVFQLPALKLTYVINNVEKNKYIVADDTTQLYDWKKHISVVMQMASKW